MITVRVWESSKKEETGYTVKYDPITPHQTWAVLGDFRKLISENPLLLKVGTIYHASNRSYKTIAVVPPFFEENEIYFILPRGPEENMLEVRSRIERNGEWEYEVISSLLDGLTIFKEEDLLKFLTEGVE